VNKPHLLKNQNENIKKMLGMDDASSVADDVSQKSSVSKQLDVGRVRVRNSSNMRSSRGMLDTPTSIQSNKKPLAAFGATHTPAIGNVNKTKKSSMRATS
jgi:hypothetical protein